MSKKAEELAIKIERIGLMKCIDPDCKVCAKHKAEAAELIDDFARKVRERCASRFAIKWKGEDEQGKHYIAAILADEED